MEIIKELKNDTYTITIIGRLDTTTAPKLEAELDEIFNNDCSKVIFDLDKLEYVSSAGLRVFLITSKKAGSTNKGLFFRNIKPDIMEIFKVTGFDDILSFE